MLVRGTILTMMQWVWLLYLIVIRCDAINRSVYKIQLTQKGYAQFIQYDIETPPLREFTFCSWINFYGFESDQTIFTYLISSDIRPLRLLLEKGGANLKLVILDKVMTIIPVHVLKNTWHNICLSYQSDFGAWAFYVDERLVSCEASQKAYGYIIPGGGSIIIGYGVGENGMSYGLEGEIYGANMLLKSTIERNHTLENHPMYKQKLFHKNKLRTMENNINYIALNELISKKTPEVPKKTLEIPKSIKHNIMPEIQQYKDSVFDNLNHIHNHNKPTTMHTHFSIGDSNSMEMLEDHFLQIPRHNANSFIDNYSQQETNNIAMDLEPTSDRPRLSLFESPPPPTSTLISNNNMPQRIGAFVYNPKKSASQKKNSNEITVSSEIFDFETPPPPTNKEPNVYGQWTSSRFAAAVLNYLKSNKFQNAQQSKVPSTIPLQKMSESYPYPNSFKFNKIVTPLKIHKVSFDRGHKIVKRASNKQNINVEIINKEDSVRNHILKSHAKTIAKNVEISSRGDPKNSSTNQNSNETQQSSEEISAESRDARNIVKKTADSISRNIPFNVLDSKVMDTGLSKYTTSDDLDKFTTSYDHFISNLPFLKSLEYFLEDQDAKMTTTNTPNDIFNKGNSKNLWHNVKSFSNDFTPKDINAKGLDSLHRVKVSDLARTPPSTLRLDYRHNKNYVLHPKPKEDRHNLENARNLATEVSHQSNGDENSVSILKYNHGYLPRRKESKTSMINREPAKDIPMKKAFHRPIKIGNALNEKHIVGISDEEKRRSFIGGNNNIPDIHRYRSDIDNTTESENLPPSLVPKVCKNVEFYDRVLYVKPDGSIDMSHILSPLKLSNIGVDFVVVNYRKCSLRESALQSHSLLLIDYNKTPVRLFGGAQPKRTRDLCGFF